jgi:hypothetical protein
VLKIKRILETAKALIRAAAEKLLMNLLRIGTLKEVKL